MNLSDLFIIGRAIEKSKVYKRRERRDELFEEADYKGQGIL